VITLHDNALSPFARKVRMVLEHKGLGFEAVDALAADGRGRLAALNPRVEVPVLEDDGLVVVDSSHIVAYLEHRYPERPVYPDDPGRRAEALAWERRADTVLDAIVHDVSNGGFGFPEGSRPPGLHEAAAEDLAEIYRDLERALDRGDFLCGGLSIADLGVFPHLTAVRFLGLEFDGAQHPGLLAWYKRMRRLPVCAGDLARARAFLEATGTGLGRPERIVWRGDRIEWLLARGFHEWFFAEIRADRIAWPRRQPR
jgi:glutathione S-transferase